MAKTLDQFVNEEKKRLQLFADYWRDENAVNAREFPLRMEDGNEGAWSGHLAEFGDGTDPDLKS